MDECPYVGVECDIMTDVITSVFAFLNVCRVFNKINSTALIAVPSMATVGPVAPDEDAPDAYYPYPAAAVRQMAVVVCSPHFSHGPQMTDTRLISLQLFNYYCQVAQL